jgi:ribonuclease R
MVSEMKERILEALKNQRHPMSEEKLLQVLALPGSEIRSYNEAVEELREEGAVFLTSNKYLALSSRYRLGMVGFRHNRTFYIVPEEEGLPETEGINSDRFVLYPNDLVRYDPASGKVYQILKHRLTNVVVTQRKRFNRWYYTTDEILPEDFTIVNEREYRKKDGRVFGCRILDHTKKQLKIEADLGTACTLSGELDSLAYKAHLYKGFPEDVRRQEVQRTLPQGRKDLSDQLCVTIDGDDARDYDDGIFVRRETNGFTLFVHIADVSFYVKEGTPIDREALNRGTSVYLPDRVYPMLPEILSNDLCSLLPNETKAAVTCEVAYDAKGRRKNYSVYPSLICSKKRLTYSGVNAMLKGEEHFEEELETMLKDAAELAAKIQLHASESGRFVLPEQELVFTVEDDQVTDVAPRERGAAERLIESFMIEANCCVDELLTEKGIEHFSRNHGSPDLAKLEEFFTEAEAVGCLREGETEREQILNALKFLEDKEGCDYLYTLLLRAQAKAKYAPESKGHYALALENYCHFTSPIRRYPDLLVHRALHRHFFRDEQFKDERQLKDIAAQVNQKEIDAVKIEREADKVAACVYAESRIGRRVTAVVTSVQPFGLYLSLKNGIEVFMYLDTAAEQTSCKLGDSLRVYINGIDWLHKRIEVSPMRKGYN